MNIGRILITATCVWTLSLTANAESITVHQLAESHLLASLNEQSILLYGAATAVTLPGYQELLLTAYEGTYSPEGPIINETGGGTGGSSPVNYWGSAEILFHCYNADLVIYQNINGIPVEIAATNVATNDC
ncbi:MAG: hypothetical protein Tsb002_19210 [Wenzhouxiangellaceae bacterium]